MDAEPKLDAGQLVRFKETTSRWYFARVRRVRDEEVELAFFDGSKPIWSAFDQIETVEDFLGQRERTFSRTREQLTEFFYARGLQRLRAERFREMQKVLRKAGIAFHPETWPQAGTRIQLWRDESVVERDDIDPELAGLLPQWVEPFVLPTGSRDPLGLQAPAERLVNEVLPGLTVFTFRAGYYGFLTWAIHTVNSLSRDAILRGRSRRDVVNALERALVLCEFVMHGIEDDSCAVIGSRSKVRVLAGANGDRYRVPDSILKNQNSAGSFRLFSTSLVSLGLATEADDLIVDGLLPFELTDDGKSLAKTFGNRVDAKFLPFALGERSEARQTIKTWGQKLCFSEIARMTRFRTPLLEGMLLGNGRDAEKRYATISELFASGLLESDADVDADDALGEDDAVLQEEDLHGASVSNLDVVLHFYSRPPTSGARSLQALAVFELLSLGLSALFRAALVNATETGKVDPVRLVRSISLREKNKDVWSSAMKTAKPRTVPKLVDSFFDTDDVIEAASIGGALLVRVLNDRLLPTVMDALSQHAREPLEIIERCLRSRMDRPLKQLAPDLLKAMVERHQVVSKRKNRQRWLCVEGDTIVRDDPQQMGAGLHALRFPQLGSLIRDLGLRAEDLRNG